MSLETLGQFEMLICSSGQEALAEVDAFKPHAVLLDVMMPGMDGPETLDALRNRPVMEGVPAMFLTARVQSGAASGLDGVWPA